jgi:predicted Zn-ribbon and HTH transcriptional regulator
MVMFMNPTGLAGKVAEPAVAVVAELKLSRLRKNCCHALVGLLVCPSRNSDCGYGFNCEVLKIPVAINSPLALL